MKILSKAFILIFIFLSGSGLYSQFGRINDPSIVAHHKRMVYQRWGDWKPDPRYVFGIQTNVSYALIWGSLAPSRNRRYKRGQDIRPLNATGEETMRQIEVDLQKKRAEEISASIDSLYKENLKDFEYYQPLTVSADPLWLLYYKSMLRPLSEFPEQPGNYSEWGFSEPRHFTRLQQNGSLQLLQEKLDVCKDRLKISRESAMPRGKRILMYHATLLEWRELQAAITQHDRNSSAAFNFKKILHLIRNRNEYNDTRSRNLTDLEIVTDILNHRDLL